MSATAVRTQYVYDFDEEAPGGRAQLGGKGIGLAEMTHMGLPVPCGFTVTTEACRSYMETGAFPEGLDEQLDAAVHRLELAQRQALRLDRRPAARVGAVGRRDLDAGDDGQRPRPRPVRRRRRRPRLAHGQPRTSRTTPTGG